MSDTNSLETYSVVIHPPEEVIQKIAVLKKQLEDAIGWYHSVNALAHITFNVFQFRSSAISIWENYIANFAKYQQTMVLDFNRVEGFSNGSFVLLANETTDAQLKAIMRAFNNGRPKGHVMKSQRPHLTIARKLNIEQMAIATSLIKAADIQFTFDQLVLRKLNFDKGQYELVKSFPLQGLQNPQQEGASSFYL